MIEPELGLVVVFLLNNPRYIEAAFGVLDAMIRVLLGPLRNLTQAVQTLTKNEGDTKVIGKF